jgi:hypothetical protein
MSAPTQALRNLVEGLQQGRITPEAFAEGLDKFEKFLVTYWDRFDSLPFPEDSPKSQAILERAASCFAKFEECLYVLREYVETQDGELIKTFQRLTREADTTLLDVLDDGAEQALNITLG